jgi:hypothetical protein
MSATCDGSSGATAVEVGLGKGKDHVGGRDADLTVVRVAGGGARGS